MKRLLAFCIIALFSVSAWAVYTDSDNDGLPDSYEFSYTYSSTGMSAAADEDGDGYTNLQEYLAGTHPQSPYSYPTSRTKNDYNNDAVAGWIWKGQSNGHETESQIWQLSFPLQTANFTAPVRSYPPIFADQANWDIVTTGDFNKDGVADIVWRNNSTAKWRIWQMQNGIRAAQNDLADFDVSHAWQVIGAGDTDSDTDDDIILSSPDTGYVMIWEMENYEIVNVHSVGANPGYVLNRIGDFEGDGDVDLLFREVGTNMLRIWEIQNSVLVLERSFVNTGAGYNPVCAADFDEDGDDDIMLINSTTLQEKWFEVMNFARISQKFGALNAGFTFLGCGDYDRDGDADTVWQRNSDNKTRVVLQQNYGDSKQTVYTNPLGGSGFVYRGNSN